MKRHHWLPLATLCVIGCTDGSAGPPAETPSAQAASSSESSQIDEAQSFGDFSFSVPSGWTVVTPDREKTQAMLLLDGTDWQNAKAMIKVDVGVPAAPSARQLAEAFAKNAGGTVSEGTLDFDGVSGVVASTSSNQLATPRKMIIVYRDEKAYLLMVGTTADIDVDNVVSTICESWKWTNEAG